VGLEALGTILWTAEEGKEGDEMVASLETDTAVDADAVDPITG